MISVVIPVFNGAHVLPTTVPAVLAMDVEEIVWVDDGSSDATAELLGAAASDPRVRIVALPANRGRAAARNAGVAQSRGDVLVFLDADVEPSPATASRLAEAALKAGALAAVARIEPVLDDPTEPYQDYAAHGARGPQDATLTDAPISWRYFLSGACAIRRAPFEQAGGFRRDVAYGEDQSLACTLMQQSPTGLRLADASVRLHDIGDLERALRNAQAYGAIVPRIASDCPELVPRGLRRMAPLSGMTGGLARLVKAVIAISPPSSVRRSLTRYLLGLHALHAVSQASTPE